MLQPEDLRRKAELLYREFVQAWLAGDGAFFPKEIRGRKTPRSTDLAAASQAVRSLRAGSKEVRGFGYSVKWREVRSRTFGQNQFPEHILFETADDLLRFVGRKAEFEMLATAANRLRSQFQILDSWIRANPKTMVEIAPELGGLIEVLSWFREHPQPGLYARELPLPVHTKFIKDHEHVLRQWFDLVLPPDAIRADEEHFERRYGLRYAEPHLPLRFLDRRLQECAGFPCDELSLPLRDFARLPLAGCTVYVVENRVNLLTLPSFEGGLALGGLGGGVTLLRYLPWLESASIWYWGDIDVEGFAILASLRAIYPRVQSLLMDRATIDRHEQFVVPGTANKPELPIHLNDQERSCFLYCREHNLRLEQERIPQTEVLIEMANRVERRRPRIRMDRPT
jgi:hypothetical protein